MKFLFSLVLVLFLGMPAYAAFEGPGAAGGPATTVSQAKNLPDDALVTLVGNIVSQLPHSDDMYIFRDNTGEIRVDIDHKYFRGQKVTPENLVRISGEVDKDFGRAPEIDVKMLEVLK